MRPLQIYLDSSDISRLSLEGEQTLEELEVLEFLTSLQSQGKVQLRFSEAHVTEAAPVTKSAIPMAIRRLNTIKRLCGKNCLIHPIDLIEHELDSARSNRESHRLPAFRNDGFWFPKLFHSSDHIPTPESILADDLAKLDRQSRRRLLKNGKLTAAAHKLFRADLPTFGQEISKKFPLSEKALRIIEQYYLGNGSHGMAVKAVNDSLADLNEIGQWHIKDWEAAKEFSRHLREAGAGFQEGLKSSKEQSASLIESLIADGHNRETVSRIFLEVFYEKLPQSSIELANALSNEPNEQLPKIENPWISLPGISTAITLAMHIARRSVAVNQGRLPKQSDFGDTYHALYLPYVDIFRADAFVGGVISECKLPISTVVVDRFLDLPRKIEFALDNVPS